LNARKARPRRNARSASLTADSKSVSCSRRLVLRASHCVTRGCALRDCLPQKWDDGARASGR